MIAARHAAAAAVGCLLMLVGACATTSSSLTSSADRLEHNTDVLARNARDDSFSGFNRDARRLADQAHDFRETVEDDRSDEGDVRRAFEDLSRDYHALRDEVDRSDSREAEHDFRPVTEAYLDIERAMGGYPEHDRYARDRDGRHRY